MTHAAQPNAYATAERSRLNPRPLHAAFPCVYTVWERQSDLVSWRNIIISRQSCRLHRHVTNVSCLHTTTTTTTTTATTTTTTTRIQRRKSRFLTISSLRREPSPVRTLKWPGCNRVQLTCNTSRAYHVQHVVLRAT